ncbi:MAG: bifunctional phosphoserine phosphatase/homoserine phosphotransferase ThrH [Acidimicrobiaceae bacterium]|nr:bifunctional phosphoserine phosphatase/homoserine phosphotransferase ThrH [Acidimicrobiaceae bacterium]
MPSRPQSLAVLDVEGVLTPEVWIAVAERTGIDFLRRTTRDEPDYDVLMKGRIAALDAAGITMTTIMEVVEGLEPLTGAREFLDELQSRVPVVLLSDTFEQFGRPLMAQLGWPLLLCHTLVVEGDRLADYRLRVADQKARSVEAFGALNYRVVAVGDSYNDMTMLAAADAGILFRAPDNVIAEHPQYPCCTAYRDLLNKIDNCVLNFS